MGPAVAASAADLVLEKHEKALSAGQVGGLMAVEGQNDLAHPARLLAKGLETARTTNLVRAPEGAGQVTVLPPGVGLHGRWSETQAPAAAGLEALQRDGLRELAYLLENHGNGWKAGGDLAIIRLLGVGSDGCEHQDRQRYEDTEDFALHRLLLLCWLPPAPGR